MEKTKLFKDPVSSFTHLAFALLSLPTTAVLIYTAALHATVWHVVSFSIFGLAMLLLYSASAIYHMLPVSDKATKVLRKIDHMMIFILIAGTYTPICLVPLRGVWGFTLFGIVWGIAIMGIILKAVWMDAPRWLSTVIYVVMGWCVVVAFYPLFQRVSWYGVWLLISGGLAYTLGAVFYALKWPRITWPHFGFHEIFHLFVMGGTVCHVLFMFLFVLPA